KKLVHNIKSIQSINIIISNGLRFIIVWILSYFCVDLLFLTVDSNPYGLYTYLNVLFHTLSIIFCMEINNLLLIYFVWKTLLIFLIFIIFFKLLKLFFKAFIFNIFILIMI